VSLWDAYIAPYLLWVKLALGAAALAGAFWAGHAVTSNAWRAQVAADHLAAHAAFEARLIDNQRFLSGLVEAGEKRAADYLKANRLVETNTTTIIKENHDAQASAIDARFPVSWRTVRMHDAAALGVAPADLAAAAGRPDDTASDVAASALQDRIASNYGACLKAIEQVKALQADDADLRARWNAYAAKVDAGR
jgi:hypothetical protein